MICDFVDEKECDKKSDMQHLKSNDYDNIKSQSYVDLMNKKSFRKIIFQSLMVCLKINRCLESICVIRI
jgi:hypothetical protein